jgi:ankyrin repeat protein
MPSSEQDHIREFVLAGHGNLQKVQSMLAEDPGLLYAAYEWKTNDTETALQAAAHVGNRAIAEYLLEQGAPLDICTAAMLGRQIEVEQFVECDTAQIAANGAHGIPLLAHAAHSGSVELVEWLTEHGAHTGVSAALHNAVSQGHVDLTRWLLEECDPDLTAHNFQGKTPLAVAIERGSTTIVQLLRGHGAVEE